MEDNKETYKKDIKSLSITFVIDLAYLVVFLALSFTAFYLKGEKNFDGISIASIICIVLMGIIMLAHNIHTTLFISKLKKDPTQKSYISSFNTIKVWTTIYAVATLILVIIFAVQWKPTTQRYDDICTIQMYWNDLPLNIQSDLNKIFGTFNLDNFESVSSNHDGLVTANKLIKDDFNDWVKNIQASSSNETKWVMYHLRELTFGIANYDFKVGTIALIVVVILFYLPFIITRTNPFKFNMDILDVNMAGSLAEMLTDIAI